MASKPQKNPRVRIPKKRSQQLAGILFVLAFVILGVKLIFYSHASSPYVSGEAEAGTLSGSAQVINTDPNSSGNSYVQFGSPSSSGLYASDTFTRNANGGWGTADQGGTWTQVKGSSGDVSVNGTTAVFAIPAAVYTSSDQIMELPTVSELNFTGSFDVSFMENVNSLGAVCGGVNAYLAARIQNTSGTGYYRLGVSWGNGDLWLRTQNAVGKGLGPQDFTIEKDTSINPSKDYSGPPYSYHVKVNINGSNPTTFSSKVWKFGATEPANWMLTGTDTNNYGPQVAAPVGVRGVNDLSNGSTCTNYLSYTAHIQIDNVTFGP